MGRLEKPQLKEYKGKRRLYFIPLVFAPKEGDLLKMVERYWEEVRDQLMGLEKRLGEVSKIYYEMVPVGGEEGAKAIEGLKAGWAIVKERLDKGAKLEPIEEREMLTEFMDWGRCLGVGLQNEKVFNKVHGYYMDVRKRRHSHIARTITRTLGPNEAGILFMEEGHALQFPGDLEVFHIAPPSLDEIKQWIRRRDLKAWNQGSNQG